MKNNAVLCENVVLVTDNFFIDTDRLIIDFFMCCNFNIHFVTASSDRVKFLNCLDSGHSTQHLHTLTLLHGHICSPFVLTPTEPNVVSNI